MARDIGEKKGGFVHEYLGVFAIVVVLAGGGLAFGASATWLSPSSNANFSTAANWSTNAAPGNVSFGATNSTDTATFNTTPTAGAGDTSGTPIVFNVAGTTIGSISFGSSAGAFFLGSTAGNALYLSSGGSISDNAATTSSETINAPLVIAGANAT